MENVFSLKSWPALIFYIFVGIKEGKLDFTLFQNSGFLQIAVTLLKQPKIADLTSHYVKNDNQITEYSDLKIFDICIDQIANQQNY